MPGGLACPLNIGAVGHPVKYGFPYGCGEKPQSRFTHGTSKPRARLSHAANSATAADLLPGSGGDFIQGVL
jgi:hypothetical protein